ncbi:MAG: type IX secretion system sortase PorU [Bacteroidia bacterium]|nr:type IX secretion system sortase PorU [Bacteroidia bacterium]
MRKLLLLAVCTAVSYLSFSQNKEVTIHWGNTDFESVTSLLSPKSASAMGREQVQSRINLQLDNETLIYRKQWEDKGFADPNSLRISQIKYGNLTSEERRDLNPELVPPQPKYSISSTKGRETIYTTVSISPVVKSNGQFRKILSFAVDYTYNNSLSRNTNRFPISNSVLASGNWYKFKVEETGVYRIDKSFLNNLGMNTEGINPRNLQIYGHGGKPLPLLNQDNPDLDLPENAIQVVGEEDGSFDNGDFILFYGIGVRGYKKSSFTENGSMLNPYSDEAYYYVTIGNSPGRRLAPMMEPSAPPNTMVNQFDDIQFHEEDEFSPAKVGRRWFGNRFDIESEQSFEFNFPNIITGQPVDVVIRAAAASESETSMAVSINSTSINPITFNPINDPTLLIIGNAQAEIPASGETITVDLAYNNSGNPSSVGYLDYILITAPRNLTGGSVQLPFRYLDAENLTGIIQYNISNTGQFTQIWDVTNPASITTLQNDGSANISFKANAGQIREYLAVHSGDYLTPVEAEVSQIPNQNLKGTIFNDGSGNFQDIDYLIVTAPFLLQPALRLANHHKNSTGLRVKVVTTDKIYEEFNSGKQDIGAIRNFVRYIYENASTPNNRIKYLCLFGDSSVDMKNRLANNNNIIPTYHTRRSTSTFLSYMSDDYFVSLDPLEGNFDSSSVDDKLDLVVGRILADEVPLANILVDKIINYASKVSYGNWRNNFVLVSDDVDVEWEYSRLEVTLDTIGDRVTREKPYINVKKIHTDAFEQESSAGGNRYPEVTEAIINAIEVGTLILNYFGHGGEDGLAKEFIFTKTDGQNLQNQNRYPCIVTVTCEFTKFDNPLRLTGGEFTYWNKDGGAISLITTTRSIGVELGVDFNVVLAEELFGFGQDIPVPPAEALAISKNLISNPNRRVIFFVGDPALRLAFPRQSARISTLNDVPIQQATDTLKALSKVKFGGEVVDEQGNLLQNYNGVLEAKVFDKDVQRQTLGNDGVRGGSNNELLILNFKTLGEVLFNGQATVTNGRFEFEFVVPRDIQIPVGNGKVSLYAEKNNELVDQTGFNLDILVGGINENAPEDTQGPDIQLFMNDESFVSGGITNDSPFLIAKLEDENGINTASGIGHDIVAILDGDEANPFVINEYYQAELDDFTRGKVTYKLRDLEEGLHTLTLKAWDVYNNSSTADIQFVVFGSDKLEVQRVLNYPNPFVNYTEFWFEHNRPTETLDVQVQIFTVTGKVVKTLNRTVLTQGGQSRDIVWDGLDDFGEKIGKGVYVYKLTVKSNLTNQQVEKFEKLVIL